MYSIPIHIKELSVGYDNKVLCNSINSQVKKGSFVVLLGANGKGKSTLLKTLGGITKPISGEVILYDKNIENYDRKLLSQSLSFLPSVVSFMEGLSVFELLSFSRIPYKKWFEKLDKLDIEIINTVASQLEIKHLLVQKFETLSDGQKQTVNLGRCMVQQTPIVLLDEPTAHLDIINKKKVFDLMSQISNRGTTVVCATHDIHDAFKYGDVFWLVTNQGKFKELQSHELSSVDELIEMLFGV